MILDVGHANCMRSQGTESGKRDSSVDILTLLYVVVIQLPQLVAQGLEDKSEQVGGGLQAPPTLDTWR
jgi:hypothetical protein